jgi:quercetin dioxygenase-like cupin family protein
MVVKATDKQKSDFRGVPFDLLSVGKEYQVMKMTYKTGDLIPEHIHPSEQSGYVLSGIYLLKFDEVDEILAKGDSYSIPPNVEHSMEVLETGEVVEFFTPRDLDCS